jgi:hypothetical protein
VGGGIATHGISNDHRQPKWPHLYRASKRCRTKIGPRRGGLDKDGGPLRRAPKRSMPKPVKKAAFRVQWTSDGGRRSQWMKERGRLKGDKPGSQTFRVCPFLERCEAKQAEAAPELQRRGQRPSSHGNSAGKDVVL